MHTIPYLTLFPINWYNFYTMIWGKTGFLSPPPPFSALYMNIIRWELFFFFNSRNNANVIFSKRMQGKNSPCNTNNFLQVRLAFTTSFALQEIFIRIVAPEVLNSLRTDFTHLSWFLLLYATVYLNMYATEGKSPPLGFWYPSRHIDIQNSLFLDTKGIRRKQDLGKESVSGVLDKNRTVLLFSGAESSFQGRSMKLRR